MENLIVSYFNIHESRMFRKEQSGINTIQEIQKKLNKFYSFNHKI